MSIRVRVRRLAGLFAALMLAALVAAPGVAAGKPTKIVLGTPGPIINPAGQPCAFQVNFDPIEIKRTIFLKDDGSEVTKLNGYGTLSNPVTGATFLHHVVATSTFTYDAAANEYKIVSSGQGGVRFYEGDIGPWGIVAAPGLFLRITGRSVQTFDGDTFASTSFSFSGTYTDICAVLAG